MKSRISRVLVIDAQGGRAAQTAEQLNGEGWLQAYACGPGDDVMRHAERVAPSVLLLHVNRPANHDLRLLRELSEHADTHDVPLIAMVPPDDPSLRVASLRLGAVDVLTLPFNPTELAYRIANQDKAHRLREERDTAYRALADLQNQLANTSTQLRHATTRDVVTGLPNRASFDARLLREWRRCQREQRTLTLALVRVIGLQLDRESLAGDGFERSIAALGRVVCACGRRAGDQAARFGIDTFATLLPETERPGATAFAQRVLSSVAELQEGNEQLGMPVLAISVGCAITQPRMDRLPEELVALADEALDDARWVGADQFAIRDDRRPQLVVRDLSA